MPQFRATFIFSEWKQGWNESWYLAGTSLQSALLTVCGNGPGFAAGSPAAARARLLGRGAYLQDVRITSFTGRNTLHRYVGSAPASAGTPTGTTDTPWNAILCTAYSANGYKRKFFLRGIPDSWVNMTASGVPAAFTPQCTTNFDYFAGIVANPNGGGPFQLLAIDKNGTTNPKATITAILPGRNLDGTVNPATTTILAPTNTVTQFGFVRIKGVKGMNLPPKINGVWQAFAPFVNGTSFTIYTPFNTAKQLYTGTGYVRSRNRAFDNIVEMKLDRFDKKSTGAAPFVPRGRRKGKVC